MDRVIIDLGIIKIYWYSLLILIAIIIGYIFSKKESTRVSLPKEYIDSLITGLIISAIIGARIYYVIFNLEYYLNYPLEIFALWHGGLAIYGAVIAGIIYLIYKSFKDKVSFFLLTDIFAPFLILGQCIGRWGNFFNGEAFGSEVSLTYLTNHHIPEFIIKGMHINNAYYEPLFFYESLWCLIGFIILIIIRCKYKEKRVSFMTGFYLIYYPIGRFFIEGKRADSLYIGSFRVSQIISLMLIICGIIIIIRSKSKENYRRSS